MILVLSVAKKQVLIKTIHTIFDGEFMFINGDNTRKHIYLQMMHKALSKYGEIPEGEWNKFIKIVKTLRLKKNEYFINVGEVPQRLGFIAAGIFKVFYITEQGNEKIIVFRDEEHFITAFSAFIERQPTWYAIQAIEDSILLVVTLREYKMLLDNHSCWNTSTRKIVENILIEKEKRERDFLSEDATSRYLTFKQNCSHIEARIPQYYVAAYLGITPVALSRIRKKLDHNPNATNT